jgi:hypothetical protein
VRARGDAVVKQGSIFFTAVTAVAWRLRHWLGLHVYGIYIRSLGGLAAAQPAEDHGYTHRVFEPADLDALLAGAADPQLDLGEAFVRDAFGKGDACAAVFTGGRLVSYDWMAFTPTHDAHGVFVDFSPKYRYLYKAFTLPEFRGRHAIRLYKAFSDDYCIRLGRESTIAFIATDNRSSIRYALGVGNRRIGFAGYLKLGPIFLPFRTPGVRSEGFRFFMPGRGRLQGRPMNR